MNFFIKFVFLRMVLVVTILSIISYSVVGEKCTLRNGPKGNKENLLKTVSLLTNVDRLVVESGNYTYAVDICKEVSKDLPQAAVTQSLSSNPRNSTLVLGRYNDSDIIGKDNWIILTYGSGDMIMDNSFCKGFHWKSMILFLCPSDPRSHLMEQVQLLEGQSNICMAQFLIYTSLVCPPQPDWSVSGIFFTVFLIGVFLYFVIGIMYRRFVLGAKGYEQVPNYALWKSILTLPRELLRKLLRGDELRHENLNTSNQRSPGGVGPDCPDEPLLSP